MKTFRNIALILIVLILATIASCCIVYKIQTSPVDSNDDTLIEVIIPQGSSKKAVGEILKDKDLIRSSLFFNVYVKLFNVKDLKASTYYLSKNMSFKEIIETLEQGNSYNPYEITITFKEGINMRMIAKQIDESTNNSYDDVMDLLKDSKYLDELIEKYWFIDKTIKSDKLYYSLEGYLFPDTYKFSNKDVTVKEIFEKMLNRMSEVLKEYSSDIEKSNLSVHEILTLASMIEKEGKTNDFKNISSVFYNRAKNNEKFQSCATAIYGIKKEFTDIRVIDSTIMNDVNDYNTYVINSLPVGPIGNPGKNALDAAINPNETEYLYFLSDNKGVTYFFKTYQEHQQKQNQLIKEGKWY